MIDRLENTIARYEEYLMDKYPLAINVAYAAIVLLFLGWLWVGFGG